MFELGKRTFIGVYVVADAEVDRLIQRTLRIVVEITHLNHIADIRNVKINGNGDLSDAHAVKQEADAALRVDCADDGGTGSVEFVLDVRAADSRASDACKRRLRS